MVTKIRHVTTYTGARTEENMTSDEEEQLGPRWRRLLKSGLHRTGATMVLNKVTWPHEVVYTSAGKPATYQHISIPLFIHGYLIVMDRWIVRKCPSGRQWSPSEGFNVRCTTLWVVLSQNLS